jgi:lipopolysaccharide export system permease protein
MILLERYILRTLVGSFLSALIGLTAVIWITQALRELDLLTAKGQTVVMFFLVTAMSLPALITVVAPVALFAAVIYTLNKLNSDSELIVMSAAGMRPVRLLKPFLFMTVSVCVLVGYLTIHLMPSSFRDLRDLVTKIRADFVANIVKEGMFTSLESGVTFHYRERGPGGALLGIFMQDRREKGRVSVYIAERGIASEHQGKSYLILEKGSIQRQQPNSRDSSIIAFERYAIDLSALSGEAEQIVYKPRERTTNDLLFPNKQEFYYQFQEGRFRAELHDRLTTPLYPLALMLIAFVALGQARTTRQSRGTAIFGAVVAIIGLRILGFAAASATISKPSAVIFMYAVPTGAIIVCGMIIFMGRSVTTFAARLLAPWVQRLRFLVPMFKRSSRAA